MEAVTGPTLLPPPEIAPGSLRAPEEETSVCL